MSFDIALSGIQAINEQLETVSNNIANSGTYGFKASRANFASLYAGGRANGVEVGSVTQNIGKAGGVQTTGRAMDAMISGRGFFVTRDPQGQMNYTRVGIFSANKEGYVVDASGRKVQGYGPTKGGAIGVMGDIAVPTGQIPAVATTKGDYIGNLSADWTNKPAAAFDSKDSKTYHMVKQTVVFDSLGAQHTVSQYFVKTANTNVNVYYAYDGADITSATAPASTTLDFTATGELVLPTPTSRITKALAIAPGNGAATINVTLDYGGYNDKSKRYDGTTLYAGEALTTTNRADGYTSGAFVGLELAEDGSVVAKYSNEQQQVVGTLAIATFPDEGQLTQLSDTSWGVNERSGAPLYERPGVGLAGKLNVASLEGSNVDVAAELVGLMTSQRNYQANSKVITTENAMMQALMQAM